MADFDAGSIVGSLDVDLDPFDEGLARAKAEAEEFESRAYTATLRMQQEGEVGDGISDSTATETIRVKTDNAEADAALEHTALKADELGAKSPTVRVDADTAGADSNISAMMALIAGLGPALVPLGAVATAVLPAIGTAAMAGGAGMGVLALGVSDVTGALKDLTTQHTQAAAAGAADAAQAKAQAQAEYAANQQIISSTAALRNARAQAANQAITNAESIKNARAAEAQAEKTAAQQEQAASQAVITASYNRQQAITSEAQAEQALVAAREQAARDLESSANKAVDANLSLQQSNIDLKSAQDALTAAQANMLTTPAQLQQLTLNLAKAQQANVEAQEAAAQATQDNNKAQAAGVNGAPGVVSAQQAVAAARHNVRTTTEALTRAERAQTQAAVTGAANIAKAQQAVADAVRNSANSQRQSSANIASALRAQQAAYHAAAQAAHSGASSTNAALNATNAQLAKMSPTVLSFAHFIQGTLTPAFQHMKNVAADGMLPGVKEGIQAILPFLPQIDHFIGLVAGAMGHLAAEAGKALTNPFWRGFFSWFAKEAVPAITAMGHVIGNLAGGFAGLLEAFSPITNDIGGGIVDLSAKFKDFGQHVGKSSAFQSFIQYIKDNGPLIVSDIEKLAKAAGHIITALAPLGHLDLKVLGYFLDFVDKIPIPVLTALGGALSVIIPAMLIMSKLSGLVTVLAGIGTGLGLVGEGAGIAEAAFAGLEAVLAASGILLVIAAIAIAGYELVKHWSGVKHFFAVLWQDVSHAFEAAWHFLWNDVIKKYGEYIIGFLLGGPFGLAVVAIIKHWSQITHFFSQLWGDVKTIFWDAVHWVGHEFTSAWNGIVNFVSKLPGRIWNAAKGMWDGITGAFKDAIDWIIRGWNAIEFKIPGFSVGPVHWGGFTLGLPDIPLLAGGGIVDKPTLAMIGEAGPEAVVPLRGGIGKGSSITPLPTTDAGDDNRPLADAIAARLAPHFQRLADALTNGAAAKDGRYAEAVAAAFEKAQMKATQAIIAAVRTA